MDTPTPKSPGDDDPPARDDWRLTSRGDPRGYVQPHALTELWFHTGTACNLECPFCLEGSKPGDNRLHTAVVPPPAGAQFYRLRRDPL